MKNNQPKISVLMPVFNGELYLKESIDSILNQTFSDFEFLIINDCSTDNSSGIIASYHDKRIKYIKNESNLGIAASLNKGIALASGEYIARMDGDDISCPDRLLTQIKFIESNMSIAACGTWAETFGAVSELCRSPVTHEEIRCRLLFNSAFIHPSMLFKKSIFTDQELLYHEIKALEDYDLWVRLVEKIKMANIPRVLLKYRTHDQSESSRWHSIQNQNLNNLRRKKLADLGLAVSDENLALHAQIAVCPKGSSEEFLIRAEEWLAKIYEVNAKSEIYDKNVLGEELASFLFVLCFQARFTVGLRKAFKISRNSTLSHFFCSVILKKAFYSSRNLAGI